MPFVGITIREVQDGFAIRRTLECFYSRTEDIPNSFPSSISASIYKNIYQFDDAKLQGMLESVLLRMDEGYADKLVEKIKNNMNKPLKKEVLCSVLKLIIPF